jgi:pimeloyl-ACP methyl ester carboxylesterase
MKKRYWIAGATTLASRRGKLLLRPRDADWNKIATSVFHSDIRASSTSTAFAFTTRKPATQRARLVLIHGFASSTLVWSKVFCSCAQPAFASSRSTCWVWLLRQAAQR